jgi:hypothetical protein
MKAKKSNIKITASEFDKRFDEGEDVTKLMDLSTARRPNQEKQRVTVNMPAWIARCAQREASRLGIDRSDAINVILARYFDEERKAA